mmetsp:Transcript_25491/g.33241  ORF Transcript_25491/g.33241 Transcript_25491/m.33241 type:complete len:328 (+) Transcript_25491:362-1345(+)
MSSPRHQHDISMADSASIAGSAHVPQVIMTNTNGTLVQNCAVVPNAPSNITTLNTPPSQTRTIPRIDAASPSSVDDLFLYLPSLEWFKGIQVRPLEYNPNTMKPRKKIIINDQLFLGEKLYNMVAKLFDLYNLKNNISVKNKSEKVKKMGKWIYLSRKMYSCSDIHSIQDTESKQMIITYPNHDVQEFYVYPQHGFLSRVLDEYCNSSIALNKPTPNHYICFVSLIFSENYRYRILLLFKAKHNTSQNELDSRKMEQQTLWNGLTYDFQDVDVKVNLLSSWNMSDMVTNISNHSSYNPNDEVRIKVPRTMKMLQQLKTELFLDYNKI